MTATETRLVVALVVVGLLALGLAIALAVVVARWRRDRRRLARARAGRRAPSSRRLLISGGKEAVRTVWETANLVRKKGLGTAVRSSIEDLAGWAQVERPDLARLTVGGTVAILFTDIEDSTALNERIGDADWAKLIGRHDRAVRRHVEQFDGYVVKGQGDGFMAAFARSDQAVGAAVAVQGRPARGRQRADEEFRVRIGIHAGPSVRRGDDLFGRNVAMAARVAGAAEGGEVLVSATVRDAVRELVDELDPTGLDELGLDGVQFDDGREVELKGFGEAERLYAVVWEQ